ncbi:MAG TPA: RpiB/LacA/LacB family sugar-phosphate isomerase [Syntrophobacteraceae bacterium]|nr:RpiB/LacA/LacB family sugar-phosphate isomerase [Syntrophobacteraceae bacterium]
MGIAADHGGFELKNKLVSDIKNKGHEVVDFGAYELEPTDDHPDLVAPLALAVSRGEVERGVAVCGIGAGACI